MIISIAGLPGAGKSTLAKKLAEDLGWPFYSMGSLRRQVALDKGMTLAEYNLLGETDPETDLAVDRYQQALGQKEDNFVIEGRTSWHFIPQSVKIFLSVESRVGAERIWHQLQKNEINRNEDKDLQNIDDVLKSNINRLASDKKRYQKYFGFDANDIKHFDLVVDTTNLTKDEVLAEIKDFIANRP